MYAIKQSENNGNLKQKSNSVLFITTLSINATISSKQHLIEIMVIKETDDKLIPATFDTIKKHLCTLYESSTLTSSAV